MSGNECNTIKGYSKQDCCIAWLEYESILIAVVAELQKVSV